MRRIVEEKVAMRRGSEAVGTVVPSQTQDTGSE